MTTLQTAACVVGLLTALAAGLVGLDSFYARKAWTEQQIAGLQLQYSIGREDVLERRIFDLEVEKRRMGVKWPDFMEKELRRLKAEKDRLHEEIRRLKN